MIKVLLRKLDYWWRRKRVYLLPRFHRQYRALLRELPRTPADSHKQPLVIFDLKDTRIDGPQGRRFYAFVVGFQRKGFPIAIVDRYSFLSNSMEKFKWYVFSELRPPLVSPKTQLPAESILITDHDHPVIGPSPLKRIQLHGTADYHNRQDCFPWPFSMHPEQYHLNRDQRVNEFRNNERHWSLFFGGAALEKKYDKSSIRQIYRTIPRGEVLNLAKGSLGTELWHEPENQSELNHLLATDVDGMVVVNTEFCKIDSSDWLPTLARSRFFLGCPGVRYPMSHNVVEAMAVGTVPILQYAELFHPHLENGINCLTYTDADSLAGVIREARTMQTDKWHEMSQNAASYYDAHLRPETAVEKLLTDDRQHLDIHLVPFMQPGH